MVINLEARAQQTLAKIEALEETKIEYIVNSSYYDYLDNYLMESEGIDNIVLPTAVGIKDMVLINLIQQMVDLQMQNMYISPSCKKLTGYTEEEIEEIGIIHLHTKASLKRC